MRHHVAIVAAGVLSVLATSLRADLVITLSPKDRDSNPIVGGVSAGSHVVVDILLSVDGEDNPLSDLRGLQFDFAATSSPIDLGAFAWELDANAYGFRTQTLPVPAAVSLMTASSPILITLDEEPLRVATIEVTVNGTGTLNCVGGVDPGQASSAWFNAAFQSPKAFSLSAGNLRGGTVELTVAAPSPSDLDGDGVPNTGDAFPDDPTESTDADSDGVGDNADLDDDDDGVEDVADAFPLDPAETTDTDDDGVGDNTDAFPNDPAETVDTDGNGVGDNADPDDDGDSVDDADDAFPHDPTEWADSNGDGIGDNGDADSSGGPSQTRGRLCGIAMLSTSFLIFCGLSGLRIRHRRHRSAPCK